MMILLFFAVITLVLLVKLNSILGTRVGFHIPEEMIPKMDKEASEEVAIAEIDRKILDIKKHYPSFEEDSFLKKAEIAFETIFNAYAKEDLAGENGQFIKSAGNMGFDSLLQRHMDDYRELFSRVDISIGDKPDFYTLLYQ